MRVMQLTDAVPVLDPALLALRDLKKHGSIAIEVPADRAVVGMAVDVHGFLQQFAPAYRTSVDIDGSPVYYSPSQSDREVKIRVRSSLKREQSPVSYNKECTLSSQHCTGEVFVYSTYNRYKRGESPLSSILSTYLPEPVRKTTLFFKSADTPSMGLPFYTIYQNLPQHSASSWKRTSMGEEPFRCIQDSVAWHTAGEWIYQALLVMAGRRTPKKIGDRFGMGTGFVEMNIAPAMENALKFLYRFVNSPAEPDRFLTHIGCPPEYSDIFLKPALRGVAKVSEICPDEIVTAYNRRFPEGARLTRKHLIHTIGGNSLAHA